MASDDFWQVSDLAPEIRETARDAARRRGLSVDQWLRSVIVDAAAGGERAGARIGAPGATAKAQSALPHHDRFEELNAQMARLSRAGAEAEQVVAARRSEQAPALAADIQAIEKRFAALAAAPASEGPVQPLLEVLTGLNNRLDRLAETEARLPPAADAAATAPDAGESVSPSIADGLTDDWATDLDRAIAEINARQRELLKDAPAPSGEPAAGAFPLAGAASPLGHTGLADLQIRLGQLTEELRILRKPGGFSDKIDALREELAEIARTLAEAVPRRVVQTLEGEIRTLMERLEKARQQDGEPAGLLAVQESLDRLSDAIHAMAPAESLVAIRDEARALDRKIEQAGARGEDVGGLPHLQRAVAELREIAAHAATGDALVALAEEVQALGARIDQMSLPSSLGAELMETLDKRFQALSADINTRQQTGGPAAEDLVSIVEVLSNKIETLEIGRDGLPALEAIVGHLTRLAERVETSGARLEQLEQLERSFAVLLDRMDTLRADTLQAAERVAREAISEQGGPAPAADVSALRHNLDALTQSQMQSDRRMQDSLEALHDSLERLVDRLAGIEAGLRDDGVSLTAPAAPVASAGAALAGSGPGESAARPVAKPATPGRRPIDPTLPGDHPLEPGAARGRGAKSAGERIAASEAALGAAKPAEADAKANFIAAARRAAQAAANMSAAPEGGAEPAKAEPSALSSLAQKFSRRGSLMLFAAALLIGGGAAHLVVNSLDTSAPNQSQVALLKPPGKASDPAATATTPAPVRLADAALSASAVAFTPAGAPLPPEGAAVPQEASGSDRQSSADAPGIPAAPAQGASSAAAPGVATVSPLSVASIQSPLGDITGALGRATGLTMASQGGHAEPSGQAALLPAAAESALPARLRDAAAAGDARAEYEIASRYLEGRGVIMNLQQAAHWFERAAGHDLAPAQYRLGSLYEKGQGVKKDLVKARRLYRAAADSGNGKAMHNLAVLYAEGVEGKPDYGLAAHWFRKAAEHGVADSQYNLAVLHARGLGAEQNLAESYKWFALAARQGDKEAAKKRDEVEGRLDRAALVAARLAVQTFTAEIQPEHAVTVAPPTGGWDTTPAPVARARPKTGSSTARKM